MMGNFLKFLLLMTVFMATSVVAIAQVDVALGSPSDRGKREDEVKTKSINEMLFKQRLQKEKKDHDEMLKRGDEALTLSKQLENAFDQNNSVSEHDKQKLAALERIVTKIREELGGDDADEEDKEILAAPKESKPSTLKEAFTYLKSTTMKLVDELKKTSRFSISAVAIQSSNTVLKLVRFLRLRR